ncbi:Protein kinase domain [Macleaya cordata]|uniref:non-specific serine/threonine protein kinase n=1 Tax=Macleaya cordata TaxID=56857 RepID=A0A200Q2J8_MACCD|nr:Protein kinase domain [Macleaya cordata]
MEMPGRRSNYSLLSQFPEEQQQQTKFPGVAAQVPAPYYESLSAEKNNKGKNFDWDGSGGGGGGGGGDHRGGGGGGGGGGGDHRVQQQGGRMANLFPSLGLQRQSSGSSFGESSLSGEYYVPTMSMAGNDPEMFGHLHEEGFIGGGGELRIKAVEASGSSSSKSWAQQTEESYQLQLALALRLSSEATCADDPNFLDPVPDESIIRSSVASVEAISHRFWVNGCLSYFDKVPDGFYLINGMDPYVWTMCTDLQEHGRVPSIESLKAIDSDSSIEVVLIDKSSDPSLIELQNRVFGLSRSCITTKEVVDQLAKLVCIHMGDAASTGEDFLVSRWKECSQVLKDCLGSVVIPMGSLSIGLCRHRALLFKILADTIDLPCRIGKGCKYCRRDDAASCLVRFGLDREYLVDLIGKPGCLCEPDSLLNGPSSISISSPLRLPRYKPVDTTESFRSLAKQYFQDCQSINLIFSDAPAGESGETSMLPMPQGFGRPNVRDRDSLMQSSRDPAQSVVSSLDLVRDPMNHIPPNGHREIQAIVPVNPRADMDRDLRFMQGSQLVPNSRSSSELSFDVEDLDIPWSDLDLKEKIGAGSFGTVHRADWNGSDVAVKILMEQDFHAERFQEFLREVAIMKRLRHPNIVLFMGAVTRPPNLSIVTEYLSRGSLYRLLHKSGAREVLDEKRRLSMAYDVAKGMNYLHRHNPPIVHRDLKSPNLLVDKKYTVKVCDFGLSRFKANTFLSSKSVAGTPEWMAPEVLRDEPSNEKSDVYSFGVILWELVTLQPPWINLNAAQVIAAVGFKNRRLEIPSNVNPQVATLIEACWAHEPWRRPSFSSIMDTLKALIKPTTPTSWEEPALLGSPQMNPNCTSDEVDFPLKPSYHNTVKQVKTYATTDSDGRFRKELAMIYCLIS